MFTGEANAQLSLSRIVGEGLGGTLGAHTFAGPPGRHDRASMAAESFALVFMCAQKL